MRLRKAIRDYVLLLRSIPSSVVALFTVCVVAMNYLANKELFTIGNLSLDCGFTLSWMTFLLMDVICKRFGPKAAVQISVTALVVNLALCLLFWLLSLTPGHWGAYYASLQDTPAAADAVDGALNATLGGNWYVVFGSALATLISSIVNSTVNWAVAKGIRRDNFRAFALRSYVSTAAGQFVDNFVFAAVVSHWLFGWTWMEVVNCAAVAAAFELFCEIVVSPVGYRWVLEWETHNVGEAYLQSHS